MSFCLAYAFWLDESACPYDSARLLLNCQVGGFCLVAVFFSIRCLR
ncbi:MAG: hypothetical protein FWE19_05825 [Oscillospiraceae bacterium]|nr:hypothetical protein [Oscillospiraceae bacterium]